MITLQIKKEMQLEHNIIEGDNMHYGQTTSMEAPGSWFSFVPTLVHKLRVCVACLCVSLSRYMINVYVYA